MTSIAISCDHYLQRGGTEHVVDELSKHFDAPVYAGWINSDIIPDTGGKYHELFGSSVFGDKLTEIAPVRNLYAAWQWQQVPMLAEYDVLIQTGDNTAWYVPPDEQTVLKYINSPRNMVYDRFQRKNLTRLQYTFATAYRIAYQSTISYPDQYIANSDLVARRARRYWGIENVEVVYPPVDVDSYESKESGKNFYLTYSRLGPSKRIDEIVAAFKKIDQQLVIGGDGPQRDHLQQRASEQDNIAFHGYLSEEEKRELLADSKALIFAAENEDCGLVPVEGFASGTPVIGVKDGFTKYQVQDGRNGILFDRGKLKQAVERFEKEGVSWDAERIRRCAKPYKRTRFLNDIEKLVKKSYEKNTVEYS